MSASPSAATRPAPRIALIHALSHSVEPINAFMAEQWPEATRMNLLDDSLSADLARSGRGLDAAMHKRFADLADYALGSGAEAILFTCSAFGPCTGVCAGCRNDVEAISFVVRKASRRGRQCAAHICFWRPCLRPSRSGNHH